MIVDHRRAPDHDGRDQRARDPNGQERYRRKQHVQACGQAAGGEEREEREDEGEEDEADGNAVQDECGRLQRVQRIQARLDVLWPAQVLQRHADAGLVEGLLDDVAGLEVEGGGHGRAVGDVHVDGGFGEGGVGEVGGRVGAVAVVEGVDGVEVLDAEVRGDGAGDFVYGVRGVAGENVEEVVEGPGGVLVEEVVAEAGGVELLVR